MRVETIKAIFTNLLFVIGIVLLIVGSGVAVSTVVKLVVFDEYPLPFYEEQQCDLSYLRPVVEKESGDVSSDEKLAEDKLNCEQRLTQSRKLRLVENVSQAVVLLVSGFLLTVSFKRFIFERRISKD